MGRRLLDRRGRRSCYLARPAPAHTGSGNYIIRFDHWSDSDERDFGQFVQLIGMGYSPVDACAPGAWNPFHESDSPTAHFYSDCAQFPYVLRAYFAWKRGLPFSYESGVQVRGGGADPRYSQDGNTVTSRTDVLTGSTSGYTLLTGVLRDHPASYHGIPISIPRSRRFLFAGIRPEIDSPADLRSQC